MTTLETPPADTLPWWMRNNYAPVHEEVTVTGLTVEGAIPSDLDGLFVRNGANPKADPTFHWFLGDGMLHGMRLRDGEVSWYRNRYVRTKVHAGADRMAAENILDKSISTANTHVVGHAGNLWCLEEGAFPTLVTRELETIGTNNFGGKLTTSFTAHPKVCPETGEMLAFGYDMLPPYLVYHRIDAAGNLLQSETIEVPGPTMHHDFAATRNHVIFMDLPVVFDLERAMAGDLPFGWSDTYGARLGVMPRNGTNADVRWYDIDPCYVFHTMNAYEDAQGRIVMDAGRHASMWNGGPDKFEPCVQFRWTLDPKTGKVSETAVDDVSQAFPRIDDRRAGLSYQYGYVQSARGGSTDINGDSMLSKYDVTTGTRVDHDFGPGVQCGEPVFVPTANSKAEDDGYVMTYVYDKAADRAKFVVLAAQDITAAPLATVTLPTRVPHGFHGSWVDDKALR